MKYSLCFGEAEHCACFQVLTQSLGCFCSSFSRILASRDLLCLLWSTSKSCVLVNDMPGEEVQHHRGIHKGDHLSPMVCIIAMGVLHPLVDAAANNGLLGSSMVAKVSDEHRYMLTMP